MLEFAPLVAAFARRSLSPPPSIRYLHAVSDKRRNLMAKAGTHAKVPVAEVMIEAYRTVFGRLSLLLDLAWLPLILVLAATILPGYLRFYQGIAALAALPGNTLGFGIDDLIDALVG